MTGNMYEPSLGDRVMIHEFNELWDGRIGRVVSLISNSPCCVVIELDADPPAKGTNWRGRIGDVHVDYLRSWSFLDELIEWESKQ